MRTVTSRRGFLRSVLPPALRESAQASEPAGARPWASSVIALCDADRLTALVAEHDLGHRVEDVRALVRRSLRLVPDRERRPGRDDPATGSEEDLRVALDLRVLDPSGPAVLDGLLMVRAAFGSGARTGRATGRLDAGAPAVTSSICGFAVAGSAELVLPRAWAAPVEALALSPSEQERWTALRDALAAEQGVEPRDPTAGTHRLHRLLGYPDERTGALPLLAELAAQDRSLDDVLPAELRELERRAGRWALLLQLEPPGDPGTVTIWVDRDRLARGDLRRMVAVRPAQL